MENTDLKIGMAFSGGGFRASFFSLGVLSYLNSISVRNKTLLSRVMALSTVSGGTITGARYAIGIKKNESFGEIYKSLYSFMTKENLIVEGLDRLYSEKNRGDKRIRSLINAFSDVYDEMLFEKAKFGTLLSEAETIHLKHISFNATEFSNGLQFRFQVSDPVLHPINDEPLRGIIGNYYYKIPEKIAKEIRMSDILAASTCFPGGFEPINFPSDFKLPDHLDVKEISNWDELPVGLMDGGIVDNQGIEPLLLAEERMKKNQKYNTGIDQNSNIFDLLIISDVASPYMEEFIASKQGRMNFWRAMSPRSVFIISLIGFITFTSGIVFSVSTSNLLLSVLCSVLSTICFIIVALCGFIKYKIGKNALINMFKRSFVKIFRLKFIVFENLLVNRVKSLLKLTNSIFLKHVRRLNYEKIWGDNTWKNRRIMNAIYELRPGEEKLKSKIAAGLIGQNLAPSDELMNIAEKASKMGTTLWFTDDELKNKMSDSLIACGQFNICWNLLEYIQKLKRDDSNTNENHEVIKECESQLLAHWEHFNKEPLWMVREINSKLELKQPEINT